MVGTSRIFLEVMFDLKTNLKSQTLDRWPQGPESVFPFEAIYGFLGPRTGGQQEQTQRTQAQVEHCQIYAVTASSRSERPPSFITSPFCDHELLETLHQAI